MARKTEEEEKVAMEISKCGPQHPVLHGDQTG